MKTEKNHQTRLRLKLTCVQVCFRVLGLEGEPEGVTLLYLSGIAIDYSNILL